MSFQARLSTLRRDIRYALRQMWQAPAFTITVILTLALGIGATTAIFSLINSIMLKSLPVADPSSLYRIGDGSQCCVTGPPQGNWSFYSYPLFLRLQASAPEFEQMAAFEAGRSTFSVRRAGKDDLAIPLTSEYATGNYFDTFGIRAFAGRVFGPSDDRPNAAPVAVLSYREWRQDYSSDLSVIGSSFIIEGHPFTIIGIAPPGFFGDTMSNNPPDIWVPIQQKPLITGDSEVLMHPAYMAWLHVMGRLKPGASTNGLAARLTVVLRHWLLSGDYEAPQAYIPQVKALLPRQHIRIVPAGSGINVMKTHYESNLWILLALSCMVLLIACANVANLLLARGMARRGQTSLRLALGAARKQLIQQCLTESLLLSLFGGAAGVVLAFVGVKTIVSLVFPNSHATPIDAVPSLPVLSFALGVSLITGVLFGTFPAWLASHSEPLEALRGANRSTRDKSLMPQKGFVILQATLSLMLLFGAGLLTRSLLKLQHQDFGYNTDHRVSIQVSGPLNTYSSSRLDSLYRELQYRLTQIPGVQSAALATSTPFLNGKAGYVIREGQSTPHMGNNDDSLLDDVSPNYLETMGQRILRGRGLTEQDTAWTRNVAVVDENFVRRFFKAGEEPIGTRFGIFLPSLNKTYEIVGVVNSANYDDSAGGTHQPMFFAPLAQYPYRDIDEMRKTDMDYHAISSVVLRVNGNPNSYESQIHHVFDSVDPDLTIRKIQPMQDQIEANFAQPRLIAQMTGLFGVIALFLAAIGLYGVTAYSVAQRTSEIGVRMALGSTRSKVVKLILRGAFIQVLAGLVIGVPLSMVCGHLLASQLYQVKPWDPIILAGAAGALGFCALAASIIPARRAASINPVTALRTE